MDYLDYIKKPKIPEEYSKDFVYHRLFYFNPSRFIKDTSRGRFWKDQVKLGINYKLNSFEDLKRENGNYKRYILASDREIIDLILRPEYLNQDISDIFL